MSQKSTLASSEHAKHNSIDEQGNYLQKRDCDYSTEFDQLVRSTSETESDETDRKPSKESNRADGRDDIGISKKRLIRNRQTFVEKITPDQKESKCANLNCSVVLKKEAGRLYKTKYLNETALYCEDCNTSIRKKWTCLFCKAIYTPVQHSANGDDHVWINCENKKCRRWTHLGCEAAHRMQDLNVYINNENYKFFCSECNEHSKPIENIVAPRKQTELPIVKAPVQQFLPSLDDLKEFRQAMTVQSRFEQLTNTPYFYLYSETYQPIGKLLAEKGKSLLVPDQEFARDYTKSGLELSSELLEQLQAAQKKGSDLSLYRKKHYRMAAADHK